MAAITICSDNQGILEVVKQEMARVKIDILGISELKWTGMVNVTQMTLISTTVSKNPLEEMDSPHSQLESPNAVLRCSLKNDRMILFHLKANHSTSQ